MEDERHIMWGRAWHEASGYLRKWGDTHTRTAREDLAQDTAVAAVGLLPRLRDRGAFRAIVRTVATRLRARSLRVSERMGAFALDGDLDSCTAPCEPEPVTYAVLGRLVPQSWLLDRLSCALPSLNATNRVLLLAYYEGCSCAELGDRFGLSGEAVKVRIHRTRGVLRRKLERAVRVADRFDQ